MLVLSLVLMACGNESTSSESHDSSNSENKSVEKLSIGFVPSREPEEIITATDPLKELLKEELARLGYDVEEIDITVGTNYEAVGEALSAGTTDIGFIPGGTYVLYDNGAEVILTATRAGLSNDSEKPAGLEQKRTNRSDRQTSDFIPHDFNWISFIDFTGRIWF